MLLSRLGTFWTHAELDTPALHPAEPRELPGERSAETLATNGGTIAVAPQVAKALRARALELGVPVPAILED